MTRDFATSFSTDASRAWPRMELAWFVGGHLADDESFVRQDY